jgi:hypothetical protein
MSTAYNASHVQYDGQLFNETLLKQFDYSINASPLVYSFAFLLLALTSGLPLLFQQSIRTGRFPTTPDVTSSLTTIVRGWRQTGRYSTGQDATLP